MIEIKSYLDPIKFLISFITTIIFSILSCVMVYLRYKIAIIIFVILAAIYAYITFYYSGVVYADNTGILLKRVFQKVEEISWADVKELGIIGINVINRNRKNKGVKYIYISSTVKSSEDRFSMALHWPPRDKTIFVRYRDSVLKYLRQQYKQPVILFNTGNLVVSPPFEEDLGE